MYWASGDRVMVHHDGAIQPATVRGGWRTYIRTEYGVPTRFSESYLVTLDEESPSTRRVGRMRVFDGTAILGAVPSS